MRGRSHATNRSIGRPRLQSISVLLKDAYKQEPEVASLFRAAHRTGVDGIYVFQSSSEKNTTFSVRPAVFVAEAQTPDDAQTIHRNLWNLGQAPSFVVLLPSGLTVCLTGAVVLLAR